MSAGIEFFFAFFYVNLLIHSMEFDNVCSSRLIFSHSFESLVNILSYVYLTNHPLWKIAHFLGGKRDPVGQ